MVEAFGGPCDGKIIILNPPDARIALFKHPKPPLAYKYEVINFGTNKVALKYRGVVDSSGLGIPVLPLPSEKPKPKKGKQ